MKHQTKLAIALCLASALLVSATWTFPTGGDSAQADEFHVAAHSAIFIFAATGTPNVGDRCTNFEGATFSCDLPTANSSTSLPHAGSLKSLIVHPAYNTAKTDLIVAVFVNHVPTALFTIIRAGSTQSHVVHGDIPVSAGDLVQIVTQGFTSKNKADRLQFSGTVVYAYP
jgi:hypothetical protein